VLVVQEWKVAQRVQIYQESRAVAREPRDAAAVLLKFGLKFADIHYKFKSSQASRARRQSSKHTGAKQNLTQMAI